ncbi:hypothetical protein [Haloplanus salilacus]|uniref:hypothetical protein n=1 Tax=Haloplanus salilacus TaxID=2949994 RepID=UPI0030D2D4BF
MSQPRLGEQMVGAYLRLINGCDLISYNQRSREEGQQVELDVLGVKSTHRRQSIYACEVVTHLNGSLYSGTPDEESWWSEFGNDSYQHSLERLWHKFNADYDLLTEGFDEDDEFHLQFWSPYVSQGYLTDGLAELQQQFDQEHDEQIELVINGDYADCIDELRQKASETTKRYNDTAFRFLQILEHLRDD